MSGEMECAFCGRAAHEEEHCWHKQQGKTCDWYGGAQLEAVCADAGQEEKQGKAAGKGEMKCGGKGTVVGGARAIKNAKCGAETLKAREERMKEEARKGGMRRYRRSKEM